MLPFGVHSLTVTQTTVNRSTVTRRLAAILIADVVGFSRHMERDDAGIFMRLRDIRARLIDPTIVTHGGRVVTTAGDGMLLEFGSADAALRCAIDVQRALRTANEAKTSSERIELRMGINLGDVIVDNADIAGDGVNVAARLEALAEPGGIYVSASVREQVHGSLDVEFRDVGEHRVKNISRPIHVFAVVLDPRPGTSSRAPDLSCVRSDAHANVAKFEPTWLRHHSTGLIVSFIVVVAGGSVFLWQASRVATSAELPAMSVGIMPLQSVQASDIETAQRADFDDPGPDRHAIAHEHLDSRRAGYSNAGKIGARRH